MISFHCFPIHTKGDISHYLCWENKWELRGSSIFRHGFPIQEVLKQHERLSGAVERNFVPCPTDSHQGQPVVHFAPSTNLFKAITQRTAQASSKGYMIGILNLEMCALVSHISIIREPGWDRGEAHLLDVVIPRIPTNDSWKVQSINGVSRCCQGDYRVRVSTGN